MGKSRSQISRQLVSLLNGAAVLGGASSAFEATLRVENFLASNLPFPIAAVETLDAQTDPEVQGRFDVARFRVSVAGVAVTEPGISSNLASGGTASSQHSAENAIRDLLAAINVSPSRSFVDSVHGFQGEVESVSEEMLEVAAGQTFATAEFIVAAYNATRFDT